MRKPFDSGAYRWYSEQRSVFYILTLEHSNWARSFTSETWAITLTRATSKKCSPRTAQLPPRR
ncbi:hypothetical protein ACCAA_510030 [Candidatus Accumulibacter aalborgensis]|uniref:Uncharacterized protein n=1 Tax=Candidatus Accumulibacter aalborgensis TaxID=1860102 RepID=A0A1A8XTB9_9PROT|nr:hypothetical protein ACCAA_510030 [Candidatus Accumulibacter aalborgensis]